MDMPKVFLFSLLVFNSQVFAGLTPPSGSFASDDIDAFNSEESQRSDEDISCKSLNESCEGCLQLDGVKCSFFRYTTGDTACFDVSESVSQEANSDLEDIITNIKACPSHEVDPDEPATTIKPKFNTSLAPEGNSTTTTTTTTTSTTTSSETTPKTTPATTSSTTSTTTTSEATTKTSTTTSKSTSTTAAPTTPTKPAPSTTSADDPSDRGSKFDGWSFFGGILLTLGLSAIGFVSFKYYKARSGMQGSGANYNRF